MSKITLTPHASGTGTLNIAAPNTNSTRTLTLPDADLNLGNVLTTASSVDAANLTGALPAIDGSALSGVGASTTFGAVGTYCQCIALTTSTLYARNTTIAGTSLQPGGLAGESSGRGTDLTWYPASDQIRIGGGSNQATLSGTWRLMGETHNGAAYQCDYPLNLYVRIS